MKGNVTEIWRVFDGQSKQLVIPVYQRNYDWSEAQCERLFDDLEEIVDADREKHFFGAVVGKHEDSFTWVVIDGQQRLTTVSILLLALVHAMRTSEITVGDSHLANSIEKSYLLRSADDDVQAKVKLKPVKDDAEAYRRLFHDESNFHEASNVTSNYRYFRDRLSTTGHTADQIWRAIQRLEVMLLDLEKSDDPQRIFETLNSTGLALTEADKIRNFVLMGLTTAEQNRLYEFQWNPMEKNVEFHSDWFIRWYLVTMTSRTPRQDEVYEAFKKYVRRSGRKTDELLTNLHEFSGYARQITHSATGKPELDRALARYKTLHSDVILPFLMPILRDHHAGVVTLQDMVRVVKILESYLLRRTICGMWGNALNKIFANAYTELRRLRTAEQPYAEILIYLLRRRDVSSGRYPDDSEFREELHTRNIYRLRSDTRTYLFERLENLDSKDTRDIATGLESGDLSIEHIMPQKLTATWREDLGSDADSIHSTWLNRLGNLTVTAYNSSYSNSSFSTKLDTENGLRESPYRLNTYVKSQTSWSGSQIEERTRQLTDVALTLWPYAETGFAPPAVVLPTEPMGWSRSFRGRDIVGYEYGDTAVTVGAWSEAIPGVVSSLMRDRRAQVIATAGDNPMLSTLAEHVEEQEKGWVKVDASLAVFVNTSTNRKVRGLRQLFDDLELNADELIFTLRAERGAQESTNSEDGEVASPDPEPYASLVKFQPKFEEVTGSNAPPEDTQDLRAQFRNVFEEFAVKDPLASLEGHPFPEFTAEVIRDSSPSKIIALTQLTLQQEKVFDPYAFHNALVDGRALAWMKVLQAT